ncbi:organomercurial lyase [Halobacterium zhouii]|uniref:organomercurial lyase n=1 Tax=Halobacterium zhouii TaxID=2902624 RepID=UPI001E31B341|nr:organomercurial lyase [Halobacterium zhouii]
MDCDCCAATDGGTAREESTADATSKSAPESAAGTRLPDNVVDAFATAYDRPPADTLDEWVAMLPDLFPDWPPAAEQLCHTEDGPHRASTPDDEHRFVCVLDPMLLPYLTGDPVTIHSTPPEGEDVTLDVAADGAVEAPPGAVVSFGAIPEAPDGDVTPEHTYAAICPAIHVFPSLADYERWDAGANAETTPLSVERATALVAQMATSSSRTPTCSDVHQP